MAKPTKPKTPPTPVVLNPPFESGIVVGILMARGSFTGDKHQPIIAIRGNDPDLLKWIRSRIGGTISGPYNTAGRAPFYHYQISGQPLLPVMELIAAHMPSTGQRKKYLDWVSKHETTLAAMRPSAAKNVS